MKKPIAVVAVTLTILLSFGSSPWALSSPNSQSLALINELRVGKGLRALEIHPGLAAKAQAWVEVMAAQGRISHSKLRDGVESDGARLGENVGMGASIQEIHAAFVKSPHHYENFVNPDYRYIGLGELEVNGVLFVSQDFMTMPPVEATVAVPSPAVPSPAVPSPLPEPPAGEAALPAEPPAKPDPRATEGFWQVVVAPPPRHPGAAAPGGWVFEALLRLVTGGAL
ncbi:MAG: CAP domain-containing protein [Acidimicrobiia bacterium]